MDIRYYGQVRRQNALVRKAYNPKVSISLNRFHEIHRKVIGIQSNYPTEIVKTHLQGIARSSHRGLRRYLEKRRCQEAAKFGPFSVVEDFVDVKVYEGDKLSAGNILKGPCIIRREVDHCGRTAQPKIESIFMKLHNNKQITEEWKMANKSGKVEEK
jgi:hypothetical protein